MSTLKLRHRLLRNLTSMVVESRRDPRTQVVVLKLIRVLLGVSALATFVSQFLKQKQLLPVAAKRPFFSDKELKTLTIKEKNAVSHDTAELVLALDHPEQPSGLPCGKHFKIFLPNEVGKVAGEWNGSKDLESKKEIVYRNYTPISTEDEPGYIRLLIKFYRPNEHFCDGGKVSKQMDKLQIGSKLKAQGVFGRIEYTGRGKFIISRKEKALNKVNMIAAGSGITPMYQVLKKALSDPQDTTQFKLMYCNRLREDILLEKELVELMKSNPKRFEIFFALTKPDEVWQGATGRLTGEKLNSFLFKSDLNVLNLLCGPEGLEIMCRTALLTQGHEKDSVISF